MAVAADCGFEETGASELDRFSDHYLKLLDGTYDCVDRIILNGYFRLGCSPGGFRLWWRNLFGGDEKLNNSALQRMSGRFSRRLRSYAKQHEIPVVLCKSGDDKRKHLIADEHRPSDPDFTGLFLVIIGRAPGFVWDVKCGRDGTIQNIERSKSRSWVNHFSFHIMDPDWGHITFKICGQPPFATQIMLNGHEYVARQAAKANIEFTKEGNPPGGVGGVRGGGGGSVTKQRVSLPTTGMIRPIRRALATICWSPSTRLRTG